MRRGMLDGTTFMSFCLVVTLLLGIPSLVVGQDVVPAGSDFFETEPINTQFNFAQEFTIPGGFFDPSCQPFTGAVSFQGAPIGVGTTDTVVQRQADASVPPPYPSTATVPIELVQLSLVSTQPITVVCGSQSQIWDVKVNVSSAKPSTGSITITKENPDGGTFSSTLLVLPVFTFTRHIDLMQRILDVGALDLPPESKMKITLVSMGSSWVHNCPPIVLPNELSPLFCASAAQNGKRLTREQAMLAAHGVLPAQPRECNCVPSAPALPLQAALFCGGSACRSPAVSGDRRLGLLPPHLHVIERGSSPDAGLRIFPIWGE